MPADDMIVVGRIGSPYGIKGWLHLQSFTTPPENLLQYQPWFIQSANGGPWTKFEVRSCRAHKKGFVAAIAEVEDRDEAAAFNGSLIGMHGDQLPKPETQDEYYWRVIVGCAVVNESGVELGCVDHLLETGANDVMVISTGEARDTGNDPAGEVLIPFVDAYVQQVDAAKRVITVNWDPSW